MGNYGRVHRPESSTSLGLTVTAHPDVAEVPRTALAETKSRGVELSSLELSARNSPGPQFATSYFIIKTVDSKTMMAPEIASIPSLVCFSSSACSFWDRIAVESAAWKSLVTGDSYVNAICIKPPLASTGDSDPHGQRCGCRLQRIFSLPACTN